MAACVCIAQVMERRGDEQAAMKHWGKAARLGHPEGQYRLGKVSPHPLDACLWLA